MSITIYHNPRCSKSRASLALLRERGNEPEIIEYLKTPPAEAELERILTLLGMEPQALMRTGEIEYKEHVQGRELSRADAIALMTRYPKLIERPIVVSGDRAVIGRPPENVLTLL